ncbi:MAG: HYR domain-containing protein [Bacteroidota bacterium]|nr:HYR domain-containing protein [Bacteroidota bacterium]
MKTLPDRRILSVLLYCIVSTSVFGTAENAVRDDWRLLLCKSGTSTLRPAQGNAGSVTVASALTYNSSNGITSAHIALDTVSVALFFLNKCYKYFAPKGAVSPVIARLRHEAAAICPNKGLHPIPLAPSPSRLVAPSFLTSLFLISYFLFLVQYFLFFSFFISVRNVGNALLAHFRGRVNCFSSFIRQLRRELSRTLKQTTKDIALTFILHSLLNLFSFHRSFLAPFRQLAERVGVGLSSFRQLKLTAKDIALITILTLFFVFAGNDASANRLQNDPLLILNEHNHFTAKFNGTTSLFDFAQLTSAVRLPAVAITSTATGGNWSDAATWKNGVVPGAGDDVIIANGATVTIDADSPALGSLTIGQGSSGILQFDAVAARTVSVSGIVTIHSGATFRSAPPTTAGTVKDNLLVVGVSLINNGTLDFCVDSSGAGIKFIGTTSGNSMFNCEGSAKTNLQETNGVILEMDNPGKTLLFYPGADFKVCSTVTKGFLTIVSGIFKLASGAIRFSNPVFSAAAYTIPETGGFELSNANATVTGQNGTVTNQGKIIVSAGTYHIGTATDPSSLTSSGGSFAQSGGTVNIAGRFKVSGGNCYISGGTMNIANAGQVVAGEAAFHIAKDANLNMSGSPLITFTRPNAANDLFIESGRVKFITGGTFQMGTAATPALSTFTVNSEIPLHTITVFNECTIRAINQSKGLIKNDVNGTITDSETLALTAPESVTLVCNETVPAAYSSLQAFTGAGGKAMHPCTLVAASFKLLGQTQSGTVCPYTITRTYQVTDIFGSAGTAKHFIYVEDEAIVPTPEAVVEPAPEVVVEPAKEEVLKLKSAMAEFTATQSGNWSDPATWGNSGPPAAGDNVTIPVGFIVTVDVPSACQNILNNGTLNHILGGSTLQVFGNWTNNGTYNGGTNGTIDFTGNSSALIEGTSTTVFKRFVLSKTSIANVLQVNGNIELNSNLITDRLLTAGLLQVNLGASMNFTGTAGFTIDTNAGIFINGGSVTTGAFSVENKGLIRIDTGTFNIGSSSGNGIVIRSSGTLDFNGGTLNVAGRLEVSGGTVDISGGTINLNTVGHNSSTLATLNLSLDSDFNMIAGTINFMKPNGTGNLDVLIENGSGGNKNISGGIFNFGTGTTDTYRITSKIPFPNITAATNTNLVLKTLVSGIGNYNFPLVDGSGNAIPASVNLTGADAFTSAFIQMETTGTKHPNNASTTNYLNRYWTVTTNGITSPVFNVTATYADADIAGTESEIAMGSWTGVLPWIKGNDVTTSTNTVSRTGITSAAFVFAGITSDPPTVTITNGSSVAICSGLSVTLTTTVTGDPIITYLWSPSTGLSATNIPNPVANPAATTIYTVTVTDGNGFNSLPASITVTFNQVPTIANAGSDQTGASTCGLTTVTMAANSPTVGTGAWSVVTGVGGSFANAAIPNTTFTGTAGTAYTLRWTISNAPCTASNDDVLVTFNQVPTIANAGSDQTGASTCGLTTVTMAANSPTVGTGAWSVVNGVGGSFANTAIPNTTFTGTAGTAYTLRWTISNAPCTASTDDVLVTVNPRPIITISGPSPVCAGSPGNVYTTEAGMTNYSWGFSPGATITAGGTPSDNTATVTWLSGSQTVQVNYTNANGCSAASSTVYSVTVNPKPTVNITNPGGVCAPGTVDLTLPAITSGSTANLTYTYFTNAAGTITLSNPSTVSADGTYYIKGTTLAGCSSDIKPVTVTIYPAPILTITNPPADCSPATVNLTAPFITSGSTPGLNLTYWTNAATTTALGNYTNAGNGTYYIKGTDANGCYTIQPVTVTVHTTPVVTTANTKSICTNTSTNISLTATPALPASSFSWTIGTITGTVNGASAGSGNSINQTLTSSGNGGTVQYLVTPSINYGSITCTGAPYTITVTVNTPPTMSQQPEAVVDICEGGFAAFIAYANGLPTPTVQWQRSTNGGSTWTNLVNGATVTGATSNQLTVTNPANNTQFRAVFSSNGACGLQPVTSITSIVKVQGDIKIKTPFSISGCGSGAYTLSIEIQGDQIALGWTEWYNGTTWIKILASVRDLDNGTPTYTYSIAFDAFPVGTPFRLHLESRKCIANLETNALPLDLISMITAQNACINTPVTFSHNGLTGGTWTITGTNTNLSVNQTDKTITFTPTVVGCFNATYTVGSCTDTKSFMVFPASPVIPSITNTCNQPLTINAVPTVPNFTAEYAVQSPTGVLSAYGTLAETNALMTSAAGCWTIKARYKSAVACGLSPINTVSPCLERTINALVFQAKPILSAPSNTCASAFILPSVPTVNNFTAEWNINGGTFSTSPPIPTTPGCYVITARYVWSGSCGSTGAGTDGGASCVSDPVRVVIFPAAPAAPTVSAGCGIFTVDAPPDLSAIGFIPEYSFYDGAAGTWGSPNASPTTENCDGYRVKTRYVLAAGCGTTAAGAASSSAVCRESAATIRRIDNSVPTFTSALCNTSLPSVCVNTGATYVHTGTSWDVAVTDNCTITSITAALSGDTNTSNLTTLNNAVFNIGITTVTWTANDGCNTSTCQFTVTVNPKPLISPMAAPICSGGTFTVTPVDGTNEIVPAGTTYSWSAPVVAGITGTASGTNAANISGTLTNTTINAIIVVYTVTPISGNCTGSSFTVTVTVNPLPVCAITGADGPLCPQTTGNTYSAPAGMTSYLWEITGNGSIIGSTTGSSVSVSTFPDCNASFVLSLAITDGNGCSSTCVKTINVLDNTKPTITKQPQNGFTDCVSVDPMLDAGFLTWLANHGGATATDVCDSDLDWTNNIAAQNWVIDLVNHTKTITVTFKATDDCGNFIETATATYTLNDDVPPTIICPVSSNAAAPDLFEDFVSGNGCTWVPATVPPPTFNDICGLGKLTYVLSGATVGNSPPTGFNYVSTATLNLGITTVTYTVYDAAGNTATCAIRVWIKNIDQPRFAVTCPTLADKDIVVSAEVDKCDASVTFKAPVIDNFCIEVFSATYQIDANPPVSVPVVVGSPIPSITQRFTVGSHTISWVITSASGTPYPCTQTVMVTDDQKPTIDCPESTNVTAPDLFEDFVSGNGCTRIPTTISNPTYDDNCDVVAVTYALSGATVGNSPATGFNYISNTSLNLGITTVIYTVHDAAGNTATCAIRVWIKNIDNPRFAVICPTGTNKDIVVPADADKCDALVTVPAPEIDNFCIEVFSIKYNGQPMATLQDVTATFAIGVHNIIWEIIDASGNISICNQTVTVNDLPLKCPDDIFEDADFNLPYASGVIVPPPTFSNTCSGLTLTWQMVNPAGAITNSASTGVNVVPSPGTFNRGVTTITYTLTHATGTVESCSFTITVDSPPVITCPVIIPQTADAGKCFAVVNIVPATATPADAVITWVRSDGLLSLTDPYPVGVTTIIWTATNDSGSDECTQTITVTDNQPPTFTASDREFCVSNIINATYNGLPEPNADIIEPRPDWYIAYPALKELDITNLDDNCCDVEDLIISWTITFTDGVHSPISGTDQPSEYDPDNDGTPNPITLWGATNYSDIQHTITYTLTDCNHIDNKTVQTKIITIKPRPNVVKMN